MANRHLLAVNKLDDFKQWLIENDWLIEQPKGKYEVLRARKDTEKLPLIVYKKEKENLVHLSVSDCNARIVKMYTDSKRNAIRENTMTKELKYLKNGLEMQESALAMFEDFEENTTYDIEELKEEIQLLKNIIEFIKKRV